MTRVRLTPRWAVHAEVRLRLRASADDVWPVMQRFGRFITADPYHTRVTDAHGERMHGLPERGAALRIGHGVVFTWFERIGTMIRVTPGQGFAFTDLSERGRTVGFPHIYAYMLTPTGDRACGLCLAVRGRWSARRLPRVLVLCWLWWVMFQAGCLLRARLAVELGRARAAQKLAAQAKPERKAIQS